MRPFLMVVAAAALLAAGAPAARAQGVFPLKYVVGQKDDPLTSAGMSNAGLMTQKQPQIKALPRGLSEKARYLEIPVGGRQVWAVLDASSPPKLYVDLAGQGDLSTAKPIVGKVDRSQCLYGPVDVTVGMGANAATVKIVFISVANNWILGERAGGYREGKAKLDGQTYRVAVLDRNVDGRYQRATGEDGASPSLWQADAIAIDVDQDGRFTGSPGSGEIMPLSKAVEVKGRYYRVEVAADGSSVRFEKYAPVMGTLEVGLAATLMLMSDTGVHNLNDAAGKWKVPEGHYACASFTVVGKGADGGEGVLSGCDPGPLAKFEVRGGETTALEIGPPLALKVTATPAGEGVVLLAASLAGKGGETYSLVIRKGAAPPPAPRINIFGAAGETLAEENLEYG